MTKRVRTPVIHLRLSPAERLDLKAMSIDLRMPEAAILRGLLRAAQVEYKNYSIPLDEWRRRLA